MPNGSMNPARMPPARPVLLFAMAMFLTGCSSAPPESAVVSGSVVFDGKPLPDAEVHLIPKTDVNLPSYNATTSSDGGFVVKMEKSTDRPVEPGVYVAVVSKYVSKSDDQMSATNIVPQAYTDRTKSPLVVEIKPGTNDLPPFQLKSKQ